MNKLYIFGMIAVVSLVTILLRFLPFLIFGKGRRTPAFVVYLGKVLPFAIMGMLVVYCLRELNFGSLAEFLPTVIGVAVVVGLQVWKKNSLLSILGGTIVYMVLLRML